MLFYCKKCKCEHKHRCNVMLCEKDIIYKYFACGNCGNIRIEAEEV